MGDTCKQIGMIDSVEITQLRVVSAKLHTFVTRTFHRVETVVPLIGWVANRAVRSVLLRPNATFCLSKSLLAARGFQLAYCLYKLHKQTATIVTIDYRMTVVWDNHE